MAKNKDNHHLVNRNGVWHLRKDTGGGIIKRTLSPDLETARILRDEKLEEIRVHGSLISEKPEPVPDKTGKLFGELAVEWAKIVRKDLKKSTRRDYRYSMNRYVLPVFGNRPVREIDYMEVRTFISELECSPKRISNVLAPMRSVFEMAFLSGIIDTNPMDRVKNPKAGKPDIYPLSMEEVVAFLAVVARRYVSFFIVAFLAGMRFGEMAALKWRNVDFKRKIIRVRETRVLGEEGRPKTKKSSRDIRMLPPVEKALKDQMAQTHGKSDYVFLNQYGKPVEPMPMNFHVWKQALKAAKLHARSLYQTRHTYATLMLDAGEHPGWVQKQMGHETLQMIFDRYYSYIKIYNGTEGDAFMNGVYSTVVTTEPPRVGDQEQEMTQTTTHAKKGESETISNSPISVALPTL